VGQEGQDSEGSDTCSSRVMEKSWSGHFSTVGLSSQRRVSKQTLNHIQLFIKIPVPFYVVSSLYLLGFDSEIRICNALQNVCGIQIGLNVSMYPVQTESVNTQELAWCPSMHRDLWGKFLTCFFLRGHTMERLSMGGRSYDMFPYPSQP